jgi:hypothetical protein
MRSSDSPQDRLRAGSAWVAVVIGAASLIGVDLFAASTAGASPTPSCGSAVGTVDFTQTGGSQGWVAPDGVATINVTVAAGSGGASAFGAGGGGQVAATLPVLEGENITLIVGAAGTKPSKVKMYRLAPGHHPVDAPRLPFPCAEHLGR